MGAGGEWHFRLSETLLCCHCFGARTIAQSVIFLLKDPLMLPDCCGKAPAPSLWHCIALLPCGTKYLALCLSKSSSSVHKSSHYNWWYPLLYLVGKVRDIRLVLDQDSKTVVFLFPIRKVWSAANIIPVYNGQVRCKTTVGFSYDKFGLICIFYMVPP